MNENITNIYNLIQEISWHFGNHGINGECCGDLSLVEFMALKKIYESKNISIQEVGNALNFTKSGATRIIDRLENKEYVIRERSPIDGRVCCTVITDKGKASVIKIIENYTNYLDDILKEVEPKNIEYIKNSLEMLINVIEKNRMIETNIEVISGGNYC